MIKELHHLSCKERLRAVALQPGVEQAQRELINVYKYLKGGCKDDRARLFSVGPSDRTRGNEDKLKHRTSCLNTRKTLFYCEGDRAVAQIGQIGCEVYCVSVRSVREPGTAPKYPEKASEHNFQRSLPTSAVL